jgi:hypothetical protein
VHTQENFPVGHHPEIASGQACLTIEFFAGGLPEKKVYLGGMSILSILLSLESGCHMEILPTASRVLGPSENPVTGKNDSSLRI